MEVKSIPGTYVLILQSHLKKTIQVGHWGQLDLQPGYYIYVGSAFGAGGALARVSHHLRVGKRMHWHIDYLREHVMPVEVWVSYSVKHLEHEWAGILLETPELTPIQGFGCSDCKCQTHLLFTPGKPKSNWLGKVERMFV